MTNLQKLQKKIQEAVPEIMELKFGCVFKNQFGEACTVLRTNRALNEEQEETETYDYCCQERNKEDLLFQRSPMHGLWKILGRPITLEDVLVVLRKINKSWYVRDDGALFKWEKFTKGGSGHHGVEAADIDWKFNKPLHEQHKETIDFLLELLDNKD